MWNRRVLISAVPGEVAQWGTGDDESHARKLYLIRGGITPLWVPTTSEKQTNLVDLLWRETGQSSREKTQVQAVGYHSLNQRREGSRNTTDVVVVKSHPTLLRLYGLKPASISVHGILQARIPYWVAISISRWSSQPRDWTHVSFFGGWIFSYWAPWEAQVNTYWCQQIPTILALKPIDMSCYYLY